MSSPNGVIATIVFRLSRDTKAQVFKLANVARATTAGDPPAPIAQVTGKDGEIELLAAPVDASFLDHE